MLKQSTEQDLEELVSAYFKERNGPEIEVMYAAFKARLILELKVCGNAHSGVVSGHLEYKAGVTGRWSAVLSWPAMEILNSLAYEWENYLPRSLPIEIVEELIAAGAIVRIKGHYDGRVACNLTELGVALREKSNA